MKLLSYNELTREEFELFEGEKVLVDGEVEGASYLGIVGSSRGVLAVAIPRSDFGSGPTGAVEFSDGRLMVVSAGRALLLSEAQVTMVDLDPVTAFTVGNDCVALADYLQIAFFSASEHWISPRVSYDGISELRIDDLESKVIARGYSAPEGGEVTIRISTAGRIISSAYP